jgi:hypothetical protein
MGVSDQVEYIKDAQQAYEALEMLITPVLSHDCERLEITRSQLGYLLRTLNRAMREQIDTTQQHIAAVREGT